MVTEFDILDLCITARDNNYEVHVYFEPSISKPNIVDEQVHEIVAKKVIENVEDIAEKVDGNVAEK